MHYLKGVGLKVFLIWLAVVLGLCRGSMVLANNSSTPVSSILEQRQQNVVLQQWELSCAAAALATILRYQYGIPVTERSVALGLINREEYIANPNLVRIRQGFSLLDLKRFVDGLGYEGIGLGQMTLPDLFERAPVIVPVNLQGFPHFVIFRGGTSDTVLLADPAFGNITMSKTKFLNGWINYKDIGRVGFIVTRDGAVSPSGRLSARALDFLIFR
jgi:predicted double-glycine peptidase